MADRKFWPLFSIQILLMLLVGCGGGPSNPFQPPPPAPKAEFLYMRAVTGNSPSNFSTVFSTFKIDLTTGALTQTSSGTPLAGIAFSYAIDPASKFLYVSDS